MNKIIEQRAISKDDNPVWKNIFSEREYEYLTHVINGLISFGGNQIDEVWIQYGENESGRVLHIFEPFVTLNCLGYMSPSVVSISFGKNNEIEYLTGGDNGLGIFSKDVTLECTRGFPRNSTLEIDFWHFVDAIGSAHDY